MSLFHRLPREVVEIELMEQVGATPEELTGELADIAWLNRVGPIHSLLIYLAPFFARHRGPGPLRVLDIGTGSADIPVAVTHWARARGHRVSVPALDVHLDVIACARARTRDLPEVRLVAAEALQLPVKPDGVDVAICSLMLHHLPETAVAGLLRTMASVARLGFVVSDLRRSRAALATAWLLTRAISRNRLTRYDGPLSVRRAYTPAELRRLSVAAGLPGMTWRRAIAFRTIGVYARNGTAP